VAWAMLARVLVTVVPMLAPMIMGTAEATPSWPDPTRPTIKAVVTDELCTRVVARIPTNSPRIGFIPSAK